MHVIERLLSQSRFVVVTCSKIYSLQLEKNRIHYHAVGPRALGVKGLGLKPNLSRVPKTWWRSWMISCLAIWLKSSGFQRSTGVSGPKAGKATPNAYLETHFRWKKVILLHYLDFHDICIWYLKPGTITSLFEKTNIPSALLYVCASNK